MYCNMTMLCPTQYSCAVVVVGPEMVTWTIDEEVAGSHRGRRVAGKIRPQVL